MTTLTIHPENSDQETIIRLFLDALHVAYDAKSEKNDVDYFSPAMIDRLNEAKAQEARGEGVKINLDDIWK
jgi:hypothetical protein